MRIKGGNPISLPGRAKLAIFLAKAIVVAEQRIRMTGKKPMKEND